MRSTKPLNNILLFSRRTDQSQDLTRGVTHVNMTGVTSFDAIKTTDPIVFIKPAGLANGTAELLNCT